MLKTANNNTTDVPGSWVELDDMPFPDPEACEGKTRCYGIPMSEMWGDMSDRLKDIVREDCERQMPGIPLEEALKRMVFPAWFDSEEE